jgi:hypothetical protein
MIGAPGELTDRSIVTRLPSDGITAVRVTLQTSGFVLRSTCGAWALTLSSEEPCPDSRVTSPEMQNSMASTTPLLPVPFGPQIPKFLPSNVGGRTAAEHWDLTEQIFRDIVVFTARPIRERQKESGGALFTLRHIPESRIFGTKPVWRGQTKVTVSDIDRTMLDMLDAPQVGGGIQHVADCLDRYLRKGERNTGKLVGYADRLGTARCSSAWASSPKSIVSAATLSPPASLA